MNCDDDDYGGGGGGDDDGGSGGDDDDNNNIQISILPMVVQVTSLLFDVSQIKKVSLKSGFEDCY